MNVEITPARNVVVHNPPSCTCSRIIWLSNHCDIFQLSIAEISQQARVNASLTDQNITVNFATDELREVIGEVFWQIWHGWTPESGIKVE